jgi:hypothetical protein
VLNLFKSYTFTWWQIGIFKVALLTMGAAAGARWHRFFGANQPALIALATLTSAYIISVAISNKHPNGKTKLVLPRGSR